MKKHNKHTSSTLSRRSFLKSAMAAAPIVLLTPTGLLRAASRFGGLEHVRRMTFAMGTNVSIEAYGMDKALLNQAITKCFTRLHEIEELMSVYKETSVVSKLNAARGNDPVFVGDDVMKVLSAAKTFSEKTSGAFDITVEPLMKLWGFRSDATTRNNFPSDKEIAAALESVGMKHLSLDAKHGEAVLVHQNTKIDLGGIAVGYSVDEMAKILRAEGIESAFINHSGDVYAIGAPPDEDGWLCTIPNPSEAAPYTFRLKDRAASTSSGSEKFIRIGEHRLSHIIDPHNGRPEDSYMSVTVLAQTSIEADAYSTALFTTGTANAAQEMGKGIAGIEVVAG